VAAGAGLLRRELPGPPGQHCPWYAIARRARTGRARRPWRGRRPRQGRTAG